MRLWPFAAALSVMPAMVGADPPPPAGDAAIAAFLDTDHAICADDAAATADRPMLLTGYGKGGFPVTTVSREAQAFFDNGLQLGHAFAHKASIAAFKEAVRLDADCAMCLWGQAWAEGPTINYTIEPTDTARLFALASRASVMAQKSGTPREQALTAALRLRYINGGGYKPGDLVFARAMDALVVRYPDDNEIATIAADAWLGSPWKKETGPEVMRSVALLETVLKRNPDYTPAIHFYIHATEIAGFPKRAEPFADRLEALAPRASHLVHMPSHTYYWIGRCEDAATANLRAVRIGYDNARRLKLAEKDGVWTLPYHSHNVAFGLGGALMSGDAAAGLEIARPIAARAVTQEKGSAYGQIVAGMGFTALARFAPLAESTALAEPKLPYAKALWHYARGEAQARAGNIVALKAEEAAMPWSVPGKAGDRNADKVVRLAKWVLVGRTAMLEHRYPDARRAFAEAAKVQEGKDFARMSDPPLWWYPVRRSVAEALLAGGDAPGALREADRTLAERPADPVALLIRAQAAEKLGLAKQATADARTARRLWRGGVPLRPEVS